MIYTENLTDRLAFNKIVIKRVIKRLWEMFNGAKDILHRQWYTYLIRETAEEVGNNLRVNGPSSVNSKTKLGNNVNFNGLHVRGDGKLTIGDNFHSGPDVRILTRNHNYHSGDAIPYDSTYIRKPVEIGDNVWIGVGTTILPGVEIGEGAIIQAGSTVVDDISKGAIVGGHPAEQFSMRDMEHYHSLQKQNKFH